MDFSNCKSTPIAYLLFFFLIFTTLAVCSRGVWGRESFCLICDNQKYENKMDICEVQRQPLINSYIKVKQAYKTLMKVRPLRTHCKAT